MISFIDIKTLIFLISIGLGILSNVSCTKEKDKNQDIVVAVEKPIDESSPEERKKIFEVISILSSEAAQAGLIVNLESVPILVTTEDVESNKRLGFCQRDDSGKGQYIVINRKLFEKAENSEFEDPLFSTILHEIGHCYFNRDHDHNSLETKGCGITFSEMKTTFIVDSFPTSVMTVSLINDEERQTSFQNMKFLQKYFVSEIFTGSRIQSLDELKKYSLDYACPLN